MDFQYLILDATAIIHFFAKDKPLKEDEMVLIPEIIRKEIKSIEAKMILELMEDENKIIYEIPSSNALKKIVISTKETGDFKTLSKADLEVLALALDYPNCLIVSDDNAIQNVCSYLNIPFKSYSFKIKKQRKYFWKCNSCGKIFDVDNSKCTDCGSSLKRYFKTKTSKR